jgi:hypothetical protein
LARSFAAVYYQQAGPPSISAMRFVHVDTGAVVFEAEWDAIDGTERELYMNQVQAIELGKDYTFWVAYDRPMRWRSDGLIVPFPGQPGSSLNISGGAFLGAVQLNSTLTNQRWNNLPGDAPNGYFRYEDDTFATEVNFLRSSSNLDLFTQDSLVTIQNSTGNMTAQLIDANPSTRVIWADGGWSGYEDSDGVDGGDTGGIDSNIQLMFSLEPQPDPFIVEPGTSAAWFDVTHNGEGFVIEILADNRVVMYWFTYDESGEQAWYVAAGDVRGNRLLFPEVIQTSGGVFGPDFDPATVTRTVVGSASFLYETCTTGTMVYDFNGRKGRFNLERLSRVMGADCGEFTGSPPTAELTESGSWFNVEQDGHGFTIELLEDGQVLVYWFTYDQAGHQAWFFGVGGIEDGELVIADTRQTRGPSFGPDFDPADLEFIPWGEMRFDLNCNAGSVDYDGTPAGFGAAGFDLSRLSSLEGLACNE